MAGLEDMEVAAGECTCCRLPRYWSIDLVLRDDLGVRTAERRVRGCVRSAIAEMESEAQRLADEIAARWRRGRNI